MNFGWNVAKPTFIRDCIIPANDNDSFMNDKCAVCWGPYDNEHPAVRVLPCNHILGKECLLDVIENSETGDLCIVCRTRLFRPSLWTICKRYPITLHHALLLFLFNIYIKATQAYGFLPRWVRSLVRFWMWDIRPENLVIRFLRKYTKIPVRNPRLNFWLALGGPIMAINYLASVGYEVYVLETGSADSELNSDQYRFTSLGRPLAGDAVRYLSAWLLVTVTAVLTIWVMAVRGKLRNEDRPLFIAAMVITMLLEHIIDIWFIMCFLSGCDPYKGTFGQLLHRHYG